MFMRRAGDCPPCLSPSRPPPSSVGRCCRAANSRQSGSSALPLNSHRARGLALIRSFHPAQALVPFEDKMSGARRIETRWHVGITGLISRDCERVSLHPVDGAGCFANVLGHVTLSNRANHLSRIRVFPKGEGSLAPIVIIGSLELNRVAGDDKVARTFRIAANFVTLPCALDRGQI